MSKPVIIEINEKLVIDTPHFRLRQHLVDYDILLSESYVQTPTRRIYFKSGICSCILQSDGYTLHLNYSEKTQWKNSQFQNWLRKQLKAYLMHVAEETIYHRFRFWEEATGLKANNVTLANLGKWTTGLCYDDGSIKLDPKIILGCDNTINYVILHELAHLRFFTHKNIFWSYLSYLLRDDARLQNELVSYDLQLVSHLFPLFLK